MIPYLTDGNIDFDTIKVRSKEALNTFVKEYKSSLSNFKSKKSDLDPDSIRKTEEFYSQIGKKLDILKGAVNSGLEGKAYYVNLLNAVLGFRVDRIVNFEIGTGRDPKDDFRKRVIIWNGRAQPWHIGHDAMVQKGKKMLKHLDADAVYIIISKKDIIRQSGGNKIKITPEVSKMIWDTYIDENGYKGKIIAQISKAPSPIVDTFDMLSSMPAGSTVLFSKGEKDMEDIFSMIDKEKEQ